MGIKIRQAAWISVGIASIVVIALISWAIYQKHIRQQEAALRQAISLTKEGKSREALPILETYARSGNVVAMETIAAIYAYGNADVPYDGRRAAIWARVVSSTGLRNTRGDFEYAVGMDYATGHIIPVNLARAIFWLERAAESGNKEAQKKLADPSLIGANTELNQEVASYWKEYLRVEAD